MDAPVIEDAAAEDVLPRIKADIEAGRLVPYLGPGIVPSAEDGIPTSPEALVARLTFKVGVPGRIRNNLWSSAQYIETNKHRITLNRLMAEIFAVEPEPTALHRWLAGCGNLPMIVDTWYDGLMARAMADAGRADWGQVQGSRRSGMGEDAYVAYFDAAGEASSEVAAQGWKTLVYKPHGGVQPAGNLLISDSDYVEALTEIDIQTPIPGRVQALRLERGFVFIGCRFHDQMLRTYARQIVKRSRGPYYAILDDEAALTRNERNFLAELGIRPLFVPTAQAMAALAGA